MLKELFTFQPDARCACPHCAWVTVRRRLYRTCVTCPHCHCQMREECLLDADALDLARRDADRFYVVWYPRWRADMKLFDPPLIVGAWVGGLFSLIMLAVAFAAPPTQSRVVPVLMCVIALAATAVAASHAIGSVTLIIDGDALVITRRHPGLSHTRRLSVSRFHSVALLRRRQGRRGFYYILSARDERGSVEIKHATHNDLALLQAILTERLHRTPPPLTVYGKAAES